MLIFSASSFYLKAQQLAPKDGRPYNQLAVTAINAVSLALPCNTALLKYTIIYTVEPPNKGYLGTRPSVLYSGVSFIRRFKMY